MHARWQEEITRRAAEHWTEARTADLTRGKSLAVTPREAAPLLRALGLLNADASLPADRARKFFQINHMIAVLGPSLRELMATYGALRIVDAACGRSYLTLALAWWLRAQGHAFEIVGIDRNDDLVEECRRRAAMTGLDDRVRFETETLGEVTAEALRARFASPSSDLEPPVHAVIALHACDTATDEALALGAELRSVLIAAAPCCQAELARAWSRLAEDTVPGAFAPIHRVPHLRREVAATLTDTLRALLLRAIGYEVWPLEFVPSEHTPKNTLLRAMDRGRPDAAAMAEYLALRDATGGAGIRLEAALAGRLPGTGTERK
jgi:hypothetical protein